MRPRRPLVFSCTECSSGWMTSHGGIHETQGTTYRATSPVFSVCTVSGRSIPFWPIKFGGGDFWGLLHPSELMGTWHLSGRKHRERQPFVVYRMQSFFDWHVFRGYKLAMGCSRPVLVRCRRWRTGRAIRKYLDEKQAYRLRDTTWTMSKPITGGRRQWSLREFSRWWITLNL